VIIRDDYIYNYSREYDTDGKIEEFVRIYTEKLFKKIKVKLETLGYMCQPDEDLPLSDLPTPLRNVVQALRLRSLLEFEPNTQHLIERYTKSTINHFNNNISDVCGIYLVNSEVINKFTIEDGYLKPKNFPKVDNNILNQKSHNNWNDDLNDTIKDYINGDMTLGLFSNISPRTAEYLNNLYDFGIHEGKWIFLCPENIGLVNDAIVKELQTPSKQNLLKNLDLINEICTNSENLYPILLNFVLYHEFGHAIYTHTYHDFSKFISSLNQYSSNDENPDILSKEKPFFLDKGLDKEISASVFSLEWMELDNQSVIQVLGDYLFPQIKNKTEYEWVHRRYVIHKKIGLLNLLSDEEKSILDNSKEGSLG